MIFSPFLGYVVRRLVVMIIRLDPLLLIIIEMLQLLDGIVSAQLLTPLIVIGDSVNGYTSSHKMLPSSGAYRIHLALKAQNVC